ncbi:MAG: SDR family oxidoreductase, partial [Comamonadaceae bacterium]
PAYGASKGGIVQLTKATAASWAVDGIQVNAILPGWIATDLTDGARHHQDHAQLRQQQDQRHGHTLRQAAME